MLAISGQNSVLSPGYFSDSFFIRILDEIPPSVRTLAGISLSVRTPARIPPSVPILHGIPSSVRTPAGIPPPPPLSSGSGRNSPLVPILDGIPSSARTLTGIPPSVRVPTGILLSFLTRACGCDSFPEADRQDFFTKSSVAKRRVTRCFVIKDPIYCPGIHSADVVPHCHRA